MKGSLLSIQGFEPVFAMIDFGEVFWVDLGRSNESLPLSIRFFFPKDQTIRRGSDEEFLIRQDSHYAHLLEVSHCRWG